MPDDFCKVILYVWIVSTNVAFQTSCNNSHIVPEKVNKQVTKDYQLSSPKKHYVRWPLNYLLYGWMHCPKFTNSNATVLNFQTVMQESVQYTFLNLLCLKRWVLCLLLH